MLVHGLHAIGRVVGLRRSEGVHLHDRQRPTQPRCLARQVARRTQGCPAPRLTGKLALQGWEKVEVEYVGQGGL